MKRLLSCSTLSFWSIIGSCIFIILGSDRSLAFSFERCSLSVQKRCQTQPALSHLRSASPSFEEEFTIRDCEYSELGTVSKIIFQAFYKDKSAWAKLYQLAELNRLQKNFPYVDADLHCMLVAVVDGTVVGFVDLDARPCQTKPPLPRPYLSDLAVDSDHRRRGLAKALVKRGEEFIQRIPRNDLFIRVEESNEAAVAMYRQLDYKILGREVDKDERILLTLHKKFMISSEDATGEATGISSESTPLD